MSSDGESVELSGLISPVSGDGILITTSDGGTFVDSVESVDGSGSSTGFSGWFGLTSSVFEERTGSVDSGSGSGSEVEI